MLITVQLRRNDLHEQRAPGSAGFLSRLGIPPVLFWGFLGVLLFMVGDGVESGYLSLYLGDRGFTARSVASIFTVYGLGAAVAGWLSGTLSDVWGPRRVILLGLVIWLVFQVLFLTVGLQFGSGHARYLPVLLTYGLRGFGYPLFAFGFLVWITVVTPVHRLGSAMGWFWFAFTGGLPTLGSLLARSTLPHLGPYRTLWVATALVSLGGLTLLIGVREPRGRRRLVKAEEHPLDALRGSISLIWRRPATGIACLVRVINTAPEFGFFAFMPAFFERTLGFSQAQWLSLLSSIFLSNICFNLLFGLLGDRFGWKATVATFGGFGCTLTTLAFYYVPLWSHSFPMSLTVGVLYGATLAGYVPLSALMPSLAPNHKGEALSLLSLGAGASVWVGPAIVGLLLAPLGVQGIMWVFAGLYFLSALLTLTLPGKTAEDN